MIIVNILGIHGYMGSGKTSIADSLVKNNSFNSFSFSDPLYDFSKFSTMITKGQTIYLHDIHRLYIEVCGGRTFVDYADAVNFTESILPGIASRTGFITDMQKGAKPRVFLQELGTYFKSEIKDSIWSEHLKRTILYYIRTIREDFSNKYDRVNLTEQVSLNTNDDEYINIVVPDIRFLGELETLANLPSSIESDLQVNLKIVKLDISKELAAERIALRDNISLDSVVESMKHESENGISNEYFDVVIDASKSFEEVYVQILENVEGI